MMSAQLNASSPETNATVAASAGTGKTWLLVTRIIRLLLKGVSPENILAITFTRKAAAEMQVRLSQRLFEFAQCDDVTLKILLQGIDVEPTSELMQLAQHLYESLLRNPRSIKINTFHSFCQEILRKFPLEANIPPGFELLEQTIEYQQDAIESLFTEATQYPDANIANSLEILFDNLNGLGNSRTALSEFLIHRSDWWTYTRNKPNPVQYAIEELTNQLSINLHVDPIHHFYEESFASLNEFSKLLRLHPIKTNEVFCSLIENNIDIENFTIENFHKLKSVFLTDKNQPRARKKSTTLEKKLGSNQLDHFIDLHEELCEKSLVCLDQLALRETLTINSAWYRAGNRLINIYQHIKEEQRLLDFTDLEWKTYLLLNESQNAHWIQYKLDQRIEHILIDEFQDTNPTQWQLLLPLLEEISASDNERLRSVFLVGDKKQSIYRFRRAEPRLFNTASNWLSQHLGAKSYPQDKSRRSSQAIMKFANTIFSDGPLHERLGSFHLHTTTLDKMWGRVELLPLVEEINTPSASTSGLRNPLEQPRLIAKDTRYYREGLLIADRINSLVNDKTIITKDNKHTYIRYSDIIVLVQTRTHVKDYEAAMRVKRIPYLGINRGTLLDSLEVRDIIALLDTLVAPYNNLALATTLKSALFNCSDDDLMVIACTHSERGWYDRLHTATNDLPTDHSLSRAYYWLTRWRGLIGQLPVHDLLDKVYSEGNLIARFESAFPPHLRPRVRANLTRFIELALEVDSGRYPSLSHFLARLKHARANEQDAPDEGQINIENDCVRILTIHASKGLEAPAIFLADAENIKKQKFAYQTLVEWPPESTRPDYFLLMGPKEKHDSVTKGRINQHLLAEDRENANLLYVAITRARQLLFISGCMPKRKTKPGWYELIRHQLELNNITNDSPDSNENIVIESGKMPSSIDSEPKKEQDIVVNIDPRLNKPFADNTFNTPIKETPSQSLKQSLNLSLNNSDNNIKLAPLTTNDDAKLRGIVIHRIIELLSATQNQDKNKPLNSVLNKVAYEYTFSLQDELLVNCWDEALTVYSHTPFSYLYDPSQYIDAYNEVPIAYLSGTSVINGVIDRLVIYENNVYIVDYKTHRGITNEISDKFAEPYTDQMAAYHKGISQVWPDKTIIPLILFTASKLVYKFEF